MNPLGKIVAFWQGLGIVTGDDLAAAIGDRAVALAYHSGRLENDRVTYYDTREIFERDAVSNYTGDLRTLFEIRNAKAAYGFFLEAFGRRAPLDEGLVKGLQKRLTESTYDRRRWERGERPGEYKTHDYVIGRGEVGALPEDVHEEMAELLAELGDAPPAKALTAAAYFHVKFENIHPFADGNGRAGRLAMNYLLVSLGHPPAIIHSEDRKGYYAALEAWDTAQDLAPMAAFLASQLEKTWAGQLRRLGG